ncbi:glycogen debranching protein GlgX [candidate division KSB1 bacterium]|nr:glycogen debranching protein GlgX [candidate division KSB1 bacterium]
MKKKESRKRPQLGAWEESGGVSFALFSRYAEKISVCLFEAEDEEPAVRLPMKRQQELWSLFVPNIKAGQHYAYQVEGPFEPNKGLRFNPQKLVLDPYARAIVIKTESDPDRLLLSYDAKSEKGDLSLDTRSNASVIPRCVICSDEFDWQKVKKPDIPFHEWVIYEVHVKGFTAHPSAQSKSKGFYLDFIEKIPHLIRLGITAVEFLPVQQIAPRLNTEGLTDYWGYNTIGFFAPNHQYGSKSGPGCAVEEFKTLVRELHRVGIAVILDVVYNHTGEGNEWGSTFCFRGIDNPTYYKLQGPEESPGRHYRNDSGTGNILDFDEPIVRQMVLDSLRYWSQEMQVDGFRFDLATILGHREGQYSKDALFFKELAQDPELSQVCLIAEPWDITSYQTGNFPKPWAEWNDRYRDTARQFWRGDPDQVRHLAWRVTGSSDLFADDGRTPAHSINFITSHDGFTLADLYSYDQKHNEANLEDNRDGIDRNYSWNCGFEGETEDPRIMERRLRMIKNSWCLLLMSIGTPMVTAGDECFRSQKGNNNAYCQDNEISWFDWKNVEKHADLVEFCSRLIHLRKELPVLRRLSFFYGRDLDGDQVPDVVWFNTNLETPVWEDPNLKILAYLLDGSEVPSSLGDYHLMILINADSIGHWVWLPVFADKIWTRLVDTSLEPGEDCVKDLKSAIAIRPISRYRVRAKSAVVLLGKKETNGKR